MAKTTWILVPAIFLILSNDVISSTTQDYIDQYKAWKTLYNKYDKHAHSYIQMAQKKSGSFQHYTQTEKDAVEVVHLYTQDTPGIYRTVNSQYRQGIIEQIWRDYAALLDKAIDILVKHSGDCSKYEELYRGSKVLPDGIPGTATFKGFTSATKNAKQACVFGTSKSCEGCQVLMILNKAQGLSVKQFSAYPDEDEVIIKLNAKFDFPFKSVYHSNIPSKKSVIDKELKRLQIREYVKILAHGSQIDNKPQSCDGNVFVPSYITLTSFLILWTNTGI